VSTQLLGPPRYIAGAGSDFPHLTPGYRYAKGLDAIANRCPAKGILICPAMQRGKVELRIPICEKSDLENAAVRGGPRNVRDRRIALSDRRHRAGMLLIEWGKSS